MADTDDAVAADDTRPDDADDHPEAAGLNLSGDAAGGEAGGGGGGGSCGEAEEEGEEAPEGEEEEEEEPPPRGPTEEEIQANELRELGIPTEAELLDGYPFPEEQDPTRDETGRDAYKAKAREFDFFMFPISSVTNLFDLQTLNLRHSGLGDKGAVALSECLKVNKAITDLSVVDNWITPYGGEAILEAIRTNTRIQALDVSENRLGYRAGQMGHEAELGKILFSLLQNESQCRQLKKIVLRDNHIGDKDMEKVCEALCSNTWLHEIDVSYNELGPLSGKAIGNMLSSNMDLRSVNLEWNRLRGPGSYHVINDGLMENNTLTKFYLAWNGIEERAGEAFGQCLEKNGSLEEVDLSHNRIGEKAALKIASGLVQNQSLRRFNISFNPLFDGGCAAIIAAVRETSNTQLCFVDIKNADAGPRAQQEFHQTKLARPNVEACSPPPPSPFVPLPFSLHPFTPPPPPPLHRSPSPEPSSCPATLLKTRLTPQEAANR